MSRQYDFYVEGEWAGEMAAEESAEALVRARGIASERGRRICVVETFTGGFEHVVGWAGHDSARSGLPERQGVVR